MDGNYFVRLINNYATSFTAAAAVAAAILSCVCPGVHHHRRPGGSSFSSPVLSVAAKQRIVFGPLTLASWDGPHACTRSQPPSPSSLRTAMEAMATGYTVDLSCGVLSGAVRSQQSADNLTSDRAT